MRDRVWHVELPSLSMFKFFPKHADKTRMSRLRQVTVRAVMEGRTAFLLLTALLLLVAWMVPLLAGGASNLPPHLFYVPVILLGLRYGARGVLAGTVLATFLAGPALPADVADGIAQGTSDWIGRGLFFLLIGMAVTSLVKAAFISDRSELVAAQREAQLRAAIDDDQLELYYQPIVRVHDGVVVGAEALVRWNHPVRGMLGPDAFVPFAEERGVIDPLGDWVLATAIEDLRVWERRMNGQALPIQELNINLSQRQFRSGGRLVRRFDEVVGQRALPARIVAEVTETALADHPSDLVEELTELHLRGVQIAVDDFGTGNSSLQALRDLPIDVIKIDKTFVQGLPSNADDFGIVEATVALANRRGNRVVAEGVETEDQRRVLASLGVQWAQGFLFSPALPFEEFTEWVAAHGHADAGVGPSRRRILVVDDKRTDHLYMGFLLQDYADVTFADTGWDAIALLAKGTYDLVLMDIQMPELSGLDTVRAIRTLEHADEHDERRHTIVGLSARDLPEDRDTALAAEMDGYLIKPLNVADLDQVVRSLGQRPLVGADADDEDDGAT